LLAEAEKMFQEARQGCKTLLGSDHRETLMVTFNLSVTYVGTKKFCEAELMFKEVLEGRLKTDDNDDIYLQGDV
jgi:hypothetical protein